MSGILIYTKEEASRNAFAVNKFKENLDIKLVDEKYRGYADFVINRTNDYKIAEYFENKGVRVFNSSSLSRLANDKQLCCEFMDKNGIPVMEYNYKGIPAVKKPVGGHGGQGVELITQKENFEQGFVYQKPCDTIGRDSRVWVLGGKIITSIMRINENDFRSNFCLGGKAVLHNMSREEISLVNKITKLINADYIGVDFIFHKGHPIFNEIEDTVGARMVYEKTNIDIIKMYCEYIKGELNVKL